MNLLKLTSSKLTPTGTIRGLIFCPCGLIGGMETKRLLLAPTILKIISCIGSIIIETYKYLIFNYYYLQQSVVD